MTRAIYQASLEAKGWAIADLARYWGMSTRKLRKICQRPSEADWDRLENTPDLTEQHGCHVREDGQWRSER